MACRQRNGRTACWIPPGPGRSGLGSNIAGRKASSTGYLPWPPTSSAAKVAVIAGRRCAGDNGGKKDDPPEGNVTGVTLIGGRDVPARDARETDLWAYCKPALRKPSRNFAMGPGV